MSRYTEIVLENVFSGSTNPQNHSNSSSSYLLGISVSPYSEIIFKNVLNGSENPQLQSKPRYRL